MAFMSSSERTPLSSFGRGDISSRAAAEEPFIIERSRDNNTFMGTHCFYVVHKRLGEFYLHNRLYSVTPLSDDLIIFPRNNARTPYSPAPPERVSLQRQRLNYPVAGEKK